MKKNKNLFIMLILCISIIFCVLFIPRFLNFMENQTDILKISNRQHQVFIININKSDYLKNLEISQNIPIPQDIKDKMKEEQKKKQEARKAEEEKITAEKKLKEQQEKERQRAIEIAKSSNKVTSRGELNSRSGNEWIKFIATAYCGCSKCCGKSTGITASGTIATQGRTVAMPSSYKFGTKIEIQGMGTYVVEDRGGAINQGRIDIFFSNHQSALNFGKKTVYLKVVQ